MITLETVKKEESVRNRKKIYRSELPDSYSCPLCLDHYDAEFCWNHVLDTYVCAGCESRIANLLSPGEEVKGFFLDEDDSEWIRDQLENLTGKKLPDLIKLFKEQESMLDEAVFIHVNGGKE